MINSRFEFSNLHAKINSMRNFAIAAVVCLAGLGLEIKILLDLSEKIRNGINFFVLGGFDFFFLILLVGLPILYFVIRNSKVGTGSQLPTQIQQSRETLIIMAYIGLGLLAYPYVSEALAERFVSLVSDQYHYVVCQKIKKTGRGNSGYWLIFARTDKGCDRVSNFAPFTASHDIFSAIDRLNQPADRE